MRAPWRGGRDETLLRRIALAPLAPVAWIYGACARVHRRVYDDGWRPLRRFSGHVVSVGSPTAGGSGKTPAAAWIAAGLHRRGRKAVLASRGYGRQRRGEPVTVVSDGRFVHARLEEAGDEPLVLAAHAPGVPVLVGRDRALVGLRALSAFGADVLVLDDGFHHHRLHRDIDILAVDGAFGFGNGRVLPRGPLREPLTSLGRAGAVLVIDGPLAPHDAALLDRLAPRAFRITARRRPLRLRRLSGGPGEAPAALAGAEVGLLAGIAQPASFRRTLESLGARVVAERLFPDHHRYRRRDLRGLARTAPLWVTTEKDAVKLLPAWAAGADVRVLSIELDVDEPDRFLDWIEAGLR